MKYVVALIACLAIVAVFSITGTFLGWKRGGGVLPQMALWAAWIGAWISIVTLWPDKKKESEKTDENTVPFMEGIENGPRKLPSVDNSLQFIGKEVSVDNPGELSVNEALVKWPLLVKSEEDMFALAHSECQGEIRRPGLWAKCIGESLGEEKKAEALYINYRAKQLMDERREQKQAFMASNQGAPVPFICPNCGVNLQYTNGQLIEIKKAAAHNWLKWQQTCPECSTSFDIRPVIQVGY